jgi:hypothetical protein
MVNTPMKKLLFVITSFIFINNIFSQEVGISPTKLWTDNYEIRNPVGFSVYVMQPVGKLALKLEYVSAKNERNFYGFLNGGFMFRPEDFIRDSISSESSFRAIEFSIQIQRIFDFLDNYFSIGAGVSFDRFTRDKTGLASNKTYSTSEDKFGPFYLISIYRQEIFGLPIKLEILFKHKALAHGNYATDIEQPFASAMDIKELQFNFAYLF